MKRKIIFGLVFGVLLATFYWLATHAYIEVIVDNASSGTTYQLLDQGNQKTTELTATGARAKKLVRKGSYELLVQQGNASYFSVVKTGGFLGTTKISAKTASEKSREFIGNNPASCMHYTGTVLVSFGCGDSYANLQIHVPATANQPTYVQRVSSVIVGAIESIVKLGGKSMVLIKAPAGSEDQGAPHTLYALSDSLELQNGTALTDLNENELYSMRPYREGFIVYDADYEQVLYYSSVSAQPSPITIDKPADDTLKAYALSVRGESVAVAYSNNTEGEVADIHDATSSDVKSEVAVKKGDETQRFNIKGQYASVHLCGTSKLCLLKGETLEVYDASGSKPERLFIVSGVDAIESSGDSLLVMRQGAILDLDVDSRVGSIQYSLGDYQYCGMQIDDSGYALCLINSENKKIALYINPTAEDSGNIDKKVAELLQLPEVKDISAYGRFIYISPDLGEPVYNEATNSFGPDPAVQSRVNNTINQAIDRLGIDRSAYTIINTFK